MSMFRVITLSLLFLKFHQCFSAIDTSSSIKHVLPAFSLRRRHLQAELASSSSCGRYEDPPKTTTTTAFPIRIEAEDFCEMQGITVEDTSDAAGGVKNVGWIDVGDWMAYDIYLHQQGSFLASFRVSNPDGNGALQLVEVSNGSGSDNDNTILQELWSLPSTGDWQLYTTTPLLLEEGGFYLSAGWHRIAIRARSSGFKLNWFELHELENQSSGPVDETTKTTQPSGFVRVSGKSIIDPVGDYLLLRGMGFGGWMLQEPYMMLVTDSASAQHDIFANIQDLVGPSNLKIYRQAWLDNYCTQDDVRELKAAGFNSLRAPLHYNLFTLPIEEEPVQGSDTWLTEGFERLDQLLRWCKDEQVYLILDLHAAPGGQGRDGAINDYDDAKPSMWEDTQNVRKAIALWVELAKRYSDEPWIAGYDLLNEPNWNFEPGHPNGCNDVENAPLKAFYDQAIAAIRQVDQSHMIIIEGNCWCNNHNGLWPINDDNVVLSFHRYWIENTVSSIQQFLNWRDQYNVPLWMGESGENDDLWYREAVNLLESQNIGWAWWSWKKMEATSSSFSIRKPDFYQSLLDYWAGRASSIPDATTAFDTMIQLASNARLENAVRNDNAIAALTSSAQSCEESVAVVLDVAKQVRIEAESYCSMFGVTSEDTTDTGGGHNVGWIDPGDWLAFRIDVPVGGIYTVEYRVSSVSGDGQLELETGNGNVVARINEFPITSDWQHWETISHVASLSAGIQTVKVVAIEAGWNFNWIQLSLASSSESIESEPTDTVESEHTAEPAGAEPTETAEEEPHEPTAGVPAEPTEGAPTDPVESGLQGNKGDNNDKSSRLPVVISLVTALVLAVVVILLLVVLWRMRRQINASKTQATAVGSTLLPKEQELTEDYSESVITPVSADIYLQSQSRSTLVSSQDNNESSVESKCVESMQQSKKHHSESVITPKEFDIYSESCSSLVSTQGDTESSAVNESDKTMRENKGCASFSENPTPEEERSM